MACLTIFKYTIVGAHTLGDNSAFVNSAGRVFFFGVYSWLVKVLGQFSIIYFRGLGLRIGVRVWVRVRVGVRVWVRVRDSVRVRVSVVLWSG